MSCLFKSYRRRVRGQGAKAPENFLSGAIFEGLILTTNILFGTTGISRSFRIEVTLSHGLFSYFKYVYCRDIRVIGTNEEANRNERVLKTTFSKYLLSFSQSCIAYIARYWLCIDKGVKRLGDFLSILNIKCLQLYFQAEMQ